MPGIAIYPRGFVGFDAGVVKAAPSIKDLLATVRSVEFNRQIATPSLYPSNPDVDALWRDYVGGSAKMSSFATRERLLMIAMAAFGTDDFYQWCELQLQNPFFSANHKRFMNDTFDFLETGKRSLGISTWMSIVRISEQPQNAEMVLYSYKDFFGTGGPGPQRTASLLDVLQMWASRDNGFDDLLGALIVFFGKVK